MKEEQCIIYITLLTCAVAFNLSCPEPGHWNHRATAYCIDLNKYTCLIDTTKNRYIETCDGPRVEIQGYKSTINRNNFNTAKCKSERYQGLDFTTVGNSDCVFQKSKCVQEGQIVYKVNKDSSLEDDTKCMCDYTKGYLFITLPTSRCFCTPTVEDCSCFREFCSTDYQCTTEHQLRTRSWNCTNILFSDDGGDDLHTIRRNMAQDDPTIETSNVIAAAITVIFSILLMIGLVCWYKRKTNKGKIGGVMNLDHYKEHKSSNDNISCSSIDCEKNEENQHVKKHKNTSCSSIEGEIFDENQHFIKHTNSNENTSWSFIEGKIFDENQHLIMGHANNANNDIADSANDDKRSERSSYYSTTSKTSRTVSNEDGNNIGSGAFGQVLNNKNDVPKVNLTSTSKLIEGGNLKIGEQDPTDSSNDSKVNQTSCVSSKPIEGQTSEDLITGEQDLTDSSNKSKVNQTSCLSSKPTEGQTSEALNTGEQDPTDSSNKCKVNPTSCLSSHTTEGQKSKDLITGEQDPTESSNKSKVNQTSCLSSKPTEGQTSKDLNTGEQDLTDSSNKYKVNLTSCLSSQSTEGQKSKDLITGEQDPTESSSESKVNQTSCLSSEPTEGQTSEDLNTGEQNPTKSSNESKVNQTSCLSSKPTEGQTSEDLNTGEQYPTDSSNKCKVNPTSCISSQPTEGQKSKDLNTGEQDLTDSSNKCKVNLTSCLSSQPTEGQKSKDLILGTAESMQKIKNEAGFQSIIDVIDKKCTKGIESDSCTDTISAPHDTSSTGSDDNGNDNIAVSKDLE